MHVAMHVGMYCSHARCLWLLSDLHITIFGELSQCLLARFDVLFC
jgi:hypothetical protein